MSTAKPAISTTELFELIAQQLNTEPDALTPATLLADVPGWDSMGVLLLMAEFDDRLGMTLNSEKLGSLKSIGDIVAAVKEANLLAD